MDLDLIWKSILIVVAGTILLRIAGRKSISQMTLAQTVIMIGIGSLLIQPIVGESIWVTLIVGGILVLTLVVMEYAQLKVDGIEKLIIGKSKILIENGHLQEKNLKKLRLTVDQLEMNLRQQNVSKISDVQWATLEPNGRIAMVLKDEAQPVTKKEFQTLQQNIEQIMQTLNKQAPIQQQTNQPKSNEQDIFVEVDKKGHKIKPPNYLQ
ncbi:MAG TPA: DUF421 domain-containing protein [Pseudogracilibacillus sp.]|nr:DUF421 domain-containing protein [Pseudogracilibacillus sp.]